MRTRLLPLAIIALTAASPVPAHAGQQLADPSELVRQLGEFRAAIDARVQSNTGTQMPDERKRGMIYVAIRSAGAAAVPALTNGLSDASVAVRRNVALFLEWEGGGYAKRPQDALDLRPFLAALTAALHDPDERVQELSAQALGHLGPDAAIAVPDLVRLLDAPGEGARNSACIGLSGIGLPAMAALPALREALADARPATRRFAQRAIDAIARDPAVPRL